MESIPQQPFHNSQFLMVENIRIHARVWNSFQNKGQVLLVHGLGGSTYSWEETATRLQREGYDVIAVDLPGFGYSDRALSFVHTQEKRAQLLWLFLDQLEETVDPSWKNKQWILAGHSMGGGTVAAMTVEQQARTKAMVLVAGALFDSGSGVLPKLLYYPPAAKWMELFLDRFGSTEERIRNTLESANGGPLKEGQYEGYRAPLMIRNTAATWVRMVRTSASLEDEAYEEILVPVVGIWGDRDRWVPEMETERIRIKIPHARFVVIDGAGHLPMESHPKEFQEQLLFLLSSL
jgi:pimeloyl-ACP methyl ester carboxylesterase